MITLSGETEQKLFVSVKVAPGVDSTPTTARNGLFA